MADEMKEALSDYHKALRLKDHSEEGDPFIEQILADAKRTIHKAGQTIVNRLVREAT